MTKQFVNIGTTANDGTGTNWRDAWDIVNDNTLEQYPSDDLLTSGNMKFDSVKFHTMEIAGDLGNTHQLGQEDYILVTNKTGSTVAVGTAVRVTGYDSTTDNPTFSLSDAATTDTAEFDGVTTTPMDDGEVGLVTSFGRVNDLDTSSFTAGDELFVSDTTPGAIVNVRPDVAVVVGHAGKISATTGFIIILREPVNFSVFGGFSHLVDITFAVAATPQVLPFDTNDEVNGITHSTTVSNEEFTIVSSGVYQITLEPQLNRSGGASSETLDAWMELDTGAGFVNVANSNVQSNAGSAGDASISPLTITRSLTAGDKIRFRAEVSANTLFLDFVAAGANAPATPAVLLNLVRVGP